MPLKTRCRELGRCVRNVALQINGRPGQLPAGPRRLSSGGRRGGALRQLLTAGGVGRGERCPVPTPPSAPPVRPPRGGERFPGQPSAASAPPLLAGLRAAAGPEGTRNLGGGRRARRLIAARRPGLGAGGRLRARPRIVFPEAPALPADLLRPVGKARTEGCDSKFFSPKFPL